MTKKSLARQERDRKAKEEANQVKELEKMKSSNKCWDELQDLYNKFSEALVSSHQQVLTIYTTPGLINYIPNKEETKISLDGLSRDVVYFQNELSSIYETHKHKTGGFKDEGDLLISIQVFEAYSSYQLKYDSVIMQNITFLLTQAEQALAIVSEIHNKENNLTDPNVISDAVIKNEVH